MIKCFTGHLINVNDDKKKPSFVTCSVPIYWTGMSVNLIVLLFLIVFNCPTDCEQRMNEKR